MKRSVAIEWLEQHGELGQRYLEEAEHHEGRGYFPDLFPEGEAGLEALHRDFELYVELELEEE